MTAHPTADNKALPRNGDRQAIEIRSLVLELRTGFVVIIVALTAMGYVCWRSAQRSSEIDAWVEHTDLVLRRIDRLRSTIQQAEEGQRSYLDTGEERYLEPMREARATVRTQLAALHGLTGDNPDQLRRLAALAPMVAARLALIDDAARRPDSLGKAAALGVDSSAADRLTSEISLRLNDFAGVETVLLGQRRAAETRAARRDALAIVLDGGVGVVAVCLVSL